MRMKASLRLRPELDAGLKRLVFCLAVFTPGESISVAAPAESCAAKAGIKHQAESSHFFLAHSRSIAGTVASIPIIVPVGVLETAAWIPPVLIAQSLACSPALFLDIGTRSGGAMSALCLTVIPHFVTIPDLLLSSYLTRETHDLRRVDIASIVNDRMETADCYEFEGEAQSAAFENQKAAYAELEKLILDDRYYKTLTPVQLDEIDSRLRSLKAKMAEITGKKQRSDI